MAMKLGMGLDIRLLDSLNFLPMKLSAMPKTFGINDFKKGYFPHFMNTDANQNYCGRYPDPKMYGIDTFSTKDLAEFRTWYRNIPESAIFDFKQELFDYCVSDVNILRKATLSFRHIVIEATKTECIGGVD